MDAATGNRKVLQQSPGSSIASVSQVSGSAVDTPHRSASQVSTQGSATKELEQTLRQHKEDREKNRQKQQAKVPPEPPASSPLSALAKLTQEARGEEPELQVKLAQLQVEPTEPKADAPAEIPKAAEEPKGEPKAVELYSHQELLQMQKYQAELAAKDRQQAAPSGGSGLNEAQRKEAKAAQGITGDGRPTTPDEAPAESPAAPAPVALEAAEEFAQEQLAREERKRQWQEEAYRLHLFSRDTLPDTETSPTTPPKAAPAPETLTQLEQPHTSPTKPAAHTPRSKSAPTPPTKPSPTPKTPTEPPLLPSPIRAEMARLRAEVQEWGRGSRQQRQPG